MISTFSSTKKNTRLSHNKLNQSPKPLAQYKFYLDIRNCSTANKLETQIKELGGSVELFLVKEVTHVITDRETCCDIKGGGNVPKTPQSVSNDLQYDVSPAASSKNREKLRPKTRADAMLERARQQPNVVVKDPLDEAKRWGIFIWSVDKAFVWLDKVAVSVKVALEKKKSKVCELKAPYIKFEAFDRKSRPVFQEIPNWPILNLRGAPGDPAFICRSNGERNMTRKTRNNHPRINAAIQLGYCEVCHVDYTSLGKHLNSEAHQKFVKDESNFLGLDSLINTGSSIESFLKINGIKFGEKCNDKKSDCYTAPLTRNKMPRTRTSSVCDRIKHSPLSPTGSDMGHHLRPRRQASMSNNFINANVENVRELRSSGRLSGSLKPVESIEPLEHIEKEKTTWDSGRPKRSCIKQKRISADERLVVDNKTYYKVEVMPSKLRSSGICTRDEVLRKVRSRSPVDEESEDEKALIVKFRKLRNSELARLNDEAENFLFPRKDDLSSDDDIDAGGPNTTVSSKRGDSTVLLSSEHDKRKFDHDEDLSMDSNCSESSSSGCKKRRRTQAEAFIMDNQKYYKFETPGSRLRYQGSYLHPISPKSPKNNGEYLSRRGSSKCREMDENDESNKININELQFSFERVPKSEPWYETFQRQDQGDMYYTCFSDSGYWKPFLLPYEMGPLPPLDPRVCVSAYSKLKKELTGPSSSNTPDSCSISNATGSILDDKYDDSNTGESSNSLDSIKMTVEKEEKKPVREPLRRGNRRRRGGAQGRHPRKSPRQHASTLAILSSFIHHRKRKSRGSEHNTSAQSLPAIPEETKEVKIPEAEPDYDAIAKDIDDLLSASMENLDQLEISVEENPNISIHYQLGAVEMLEDYLSQRDSDKRRKPLRPPTIRRTITGAIARKPGRKRKKKNRTGWPNKNRRVPSRKEESNGGNEEVEASDLDSVNDSLSVNADSEDNDDVCEENLNETDNKIGRNSINQIHESVNTKSPKTKSERLASANRRDHNSSNVHNSEINYSVQSTKLNGTNDNYELNHKGETYHKENFRKIGTPSRKERRGSSSDSCAEVVIASVGDKMDCVNVDLDKWENAEKVLAAKLTSSDSINKDMHFQPVVRVQKLDSEIAANHVHKPERESSSPRRTVKHHPRRMPASPKSPRMLRKPRGRWYRERY